MTRAATPNNRANSGMIGVRPGGAVNTDRDDLQEPRSHHRPEGLALPSIVPQVPDNGPDLDYAAADYAAADYAGLCAEISDRFMGETGDLIREHAKALIILRQIGAAADEIPTRACAACRGDDHGRCAAPRHDGICCDDQYRVRPVSESGLDAETLYEIERGVASIPYTPPDVILGYVRPLLAEVLRLRALVDAVGQQS